MPVLFGKDLAVDLGTANTLVYKSGEGIVLNEPSIVAIDTRDGTPVAVGTEAKRMFGRTPGHIRTIRPLREGVVADINVCERMLRYFIQRVQRRAIFRGRMVICAPTNVTQVERRAVQDAAEYAGARRPAHVISEPMAAAIGAGLAVYEPTGNMVIDVGGGTTDIAVISLGGAVSGCSVRLGGDSFDDAIISYLKREYGFIIGERTAEEIKIALGSAAPLAEEMHAEVKGRDALSGLPRTQDISTQCIREALRPTVAQIIRKVRDVLDDTPPELAADVTARGAVLTGGGALLHGLSEAISHETKMNVRVADNPLHTVISGAGQCVERFADLKQLLLTSDD